MARLDFLWQLQARDEKLDMEALQVRVILTILIILIDLMFLVLFLTLSFHQSSNRRILFNLLPAHVATHFLDNQFRSNMVSWLLFLLGGLGLILILIRVRTWDMVCAFVCA